MRIDESDASHIRRHVVDRVHAADSLTAVIQFRKVEPTGLNTVVNLAPLAERLDVDGADRKALLASWNRPRLDDRTGRCDRAGRCDERRGGAGGGLISTLRMAGSSGRLHVMRRATDALVTRRVLRSTPHSDPARWPPTEVLRCNGDPRRRVVRRVHGRYQAGEPRRAADPGGLPARGFRRRKP